MSEEQKNEATEAATEEAKTEAPVEAAAAEEAPKKKGPKTTPPLIPNKEKLSRRTLRAMFRRKKKVKIHEDKAYAETLSAAKKKASADRKVAFRRRHAQK